MRYMHEPKGIDNGHDHSKRHRNCIWGMPTRLLIIVFVTSLIEPVSCRLLRSTLLFGPAYVAHASSLWFWLPCVPTSFPAANTCFFGGCRLQSTTQLLSPPESCSGSGSLGTNSAASPYTYSALPAGYQNNATGAESFSNASSSFLPQPLLWSDRSMSDYRPRVPAL
jgi:hypothetical protein